MAKIQIEVPKEILDTFINLERDSEKMLSEMTMAGAETVVESVKKNIRSSFKSDKSILQGLKTTRVYKTPSDDGINTKVMFSGYNDKGVPIALIAMAREFGTSRGEAKKPFMRKAFNKSKINKIMLGIQEKYLPKE